MIDGQIVKVSYRANIQLQKRDWEKEIYFINIEKSRDFCYLTIWQTDQESLILDAYWYSESSQKISRENFFSPKMCSAIMKMTPSVI